MSEEKEKSKEDDLSKYYDFTYSDEELKKSHNLPYFEKVKHDKSCTEEVIAKIQRIRQELKEKLLNCKKNLANNHKRQRKVKKIPKKTKIKI